MQFKLSAKLQADMMEDLSKMLEDNIPLNNATAELAHAFVGRASEAAKRMRTMLARGGDISDAMRPYFSDQLCDAMRAGIKSGKTTQALTQASGFVRMQATAMGKLYSSLGYPGFVMVAVLTGIMIIATRVMPEIIDLVPKKGLSPLSQSVFSLGQFLIYYGYLVIGFMAGLVAFIVWTMPNVTGEIRATLDKIPPWSLYRQYQAAVFLQMLALLIASNISFKDSLQMIRARARPYVAWHVARMQRRLASPSGGGVTGALDTGLIPALDIRRIRLREQSGDFEESLRRTGARAAEQVTKVIEMTGRFLFVAILVGAGGMLGFMGIGLFDALSSAAAAGG